MNVSECDCIILCGGLGKRLRSVVSDVPKVMAEVDGRPFLDHIIENLKSQDIERIILCTGYKADLIENYYREKDFGITIDFSTEQEPLGTGGALKNAREIILSDHFFVLNGDSFLSADLKVFLDFHLQKESKASILVSQVKDGGDFGNVKLDDNDGIVEFEEKVEGEGEHLVNAGIYCFNQSVFASMPEDEHFSIEKDIFPKLAGNGLYGCRIEKEFMDIGTPERYESIKNKLNKGNDSGN